MWLVSRTGIACALERAYKKSHDAKSLAVALAVALILVPGCASQIRLQLEESLASKKVESIKVWEAAKLDSKQLLSTLGKSPAMVFSNANSVSARVDNQSGEFFVNWSLGPDGGISTAVPVAQDGYFLTSAHALAKDPSLILVLLLTLENDGTIVRKVPGRVVWKPVADSELSTPKPDLAVVHANVVVPTTLQLVGEPPIVNESIITAGWPTRYFDKFPGGSRLAAGRITFVARQEARGASPAYVILGHDAPIVAGDSGGPILDRNGKLVGINSSVVFPLSLWQRIAFALCRAKRDPFEIGYFAEAIMPDPVWLRKVIESDRMSADLLVPQ